MEEIRLLAEDELRDYIEISANAFPFLIKDKDEFHDRIVRSIENKYCSGAYGCFRNGALVGGMRFYDFDVNIFNRECRMGGIGLVTVDLAHKKEKVAKNMLQYFLDHYRQKDVFLAGLFAFRPDFYYKMGFGFGTKMKQYRIAPAKLPGNLSEKSIRLINREEKQLLLDYYERYMKSHHGCIRLSEFETDRFYDDNQRIAGYIQNGCLEGFARFGFEPFQNDKYNLHVVQLVYDRREALSELLCLLRSQVDQVERIVIDTDDDDFHFISDNPSNGDHSIFLHHQTNVEEIGIMYRVINTGVLFDSLKDHDFGGETLTLKLNVHDDFFPVNNESVIIRFDNGKPERVDRGSFQVEIAMNIAEFSSMVMGVVPFSRLYRYAKAEISDKGFIPSIDRLFYNGEKPVCHARF